MEYKGEKRLSRFKLRCNFCGCVQIFPAKNRPKQPKDRIDRALEGTSIHCVGNTQLLCPPHHEIMSSQKEGKVITGKQHFTVEEILHD
tara:strand:- start:215 stop:478 length:264 start_codon:yes stop_codon:yes gene_type:complete